MGSTIRLTGPFFCSQTAYPNTAMVQATKQRLRNCLILWHSQLGQHDSN
jgi:hypothetical protein